MPLGSFATLHSRKLLVKLGADNILDVDAASWDETASHRRRREVTRAIMVVKLVSDFNDVITHDEDQKQLHPQVGAEHRKRFHNCRKIFLIYNTSRVTRLRQG